MARKISKSAAATAVAAAFSLLATPAAAVDLPRVNGAPVAYDGTAENAQNHRYGGWGRYDNDIDAGDIIAGVVILGTIAAVASAAHNNNRDRYRTRYPYPDNDYRYRSSRDDGQRFESRGIDRAVDICVGEVERDRGRVGSVDNAARTIEGWEITGQVEGGGTFSCRIGNDGRISDVQVGSYGAGYQPTEDNQWDDEVYARARIAQNAVPPLPDTYETDDRRYDTGETGDFGQ